MKKLNWKLFNLTNSSIRKLSDNYSKIYLKSKLFNSSNNIYSLVTKDYSISNSTIKDSDVDLIKVINPEPIYLLNLIYELKYTGKVNNDFILLDSALIKKIQNLKTDYFTIYSSDGSFYKHIAAKLLVISIGLTIIIFLSFKNELIKSRLARVFYLILGSSIISYAIYSKRLDIFKYVTKIELSKNLENVMITTFPSTSVKVQANNLILNRIKQGENATFFIKGKKYYLPLDHTTSYNEKLLPLVLRGYILK